MELDPIQLLCSGNPLDVLIAELKKQLAAAIKAAAGKVNAAITALSDTLKAALQSLIPELPTKPSFLVDLLALKSKIEGDVAEFKTAAAALIEKWGKAVSGILTLIENLANITICDLLTLNFKMNPDGSISLESAPPKTPSGAPEKPTAAESTVQNNFPENYLSTNDDSVSGSAQVADVIRQSQLWTLREAAQLSLKNSETIKGYLAKCDAQKVSPDTRTATNLTAEDETGQQEYISLKTQVEQYNSAVNACNSAVEQVTQDIDKTLKDKNATISSEQLSSILDNLPNIVNESTSKTVTLADVKDAKDALAQDLKVALTANWKAIANKKVQSAGLPAVSVIAGQDFTTWFDTQGFRNFTADQFTSYFARNLNTVPAQSLWTNIVPTLRILDDLTDTLGARISITSSYRSPAYNRSVGGAANSFHSKFNALDIQVSGVAPSRVFAQLKAWRNQNRFKGGLGLYPRFVHIDTRGYNANW